MFGKCQHRLDFACRSRSNTLPDSHAPPLPRLPVSLLVLLPVLAAGCASRGSATPADLVLRNGEVVTMDSTTPQGRRSPSPATRSPPSARTPTSRSTSGRTPRSSTCRVTSPFPASIESHGHFTGLGQALSELKLMGVPTWQDIAQMVADAAKKAKPGAWIQGRGWHQEKWNEVAGPHREGIPDERPDQPGGAEQPGGARTRQRARAHRQRRGAQAGRHRADDAEPAGRRDHQGRERTAHGRARGRRAGAHPPRPREGAGQAHARGGRGRLPRRRSISPRRTRSPTA